MAPTTMTSVLVTGANVGLGKECARQLALKEGIKRVILACRNPEKAEAAKQDLVKITDKNVFEVLIMDVSNLESVKKAVSQIKEPIDGLVMNAGGSGGADPIEVTKYGVTNITAINVLGHVLLVDLLLKEKKLTGSAVYSGTEASRGIPLFSMPKPDLKDGSLEEIVSICDGSYFGGVSTFEATYGHTKLVATLWMSSMARKEPSVRFVTISPGGTTGTTFSRDMTWAQKTMFAISMPLMQLFGKMHTVEVGAKRYVDALMDDDMYKSGIFYASKSGVSGPVVDQVEYLDVFHNETYQENANAAIHQFIK